ncbi:MAG: hypothetical protein Q7R49_00115 [Candidatus Daviesbacteria bacterium]|nr:hypothetical protein [Candidatus Daviesbacteria bacterium]
MVVESGAEGQQHPAKIGRDNDIDIFPEAEVLEFKKVVERRTLRWDASHVSLYLSSAIVNPLWSDTRAMNHPRVEAVVKQSYRKGSVQVDGDITIPFKTEPEKIATTYKYFPGVRIMRVGEIPRKELYKDPGESQNAIVIPINSNPNNLPKIYFLSSQDKVVDSDTGTQIYP